jgi:hypothetical protein
MKMASVLLLLGMGVLLSPVVAADAPPVQTANPEPVWNGGQNDPFMEFTASFHRLSKYIDVCKHLHHADSEKRRKIALLEAQGEATTLTRAKTDFAIFFSKATMPPGALEVAKPLFEALKDPGFQAKYGKLPLIFDHADIHTIEYAYNLYATLPFPDDAHYARYVAAWPAPSPSGSAGAQAHP